MESVFLINSLCIQDPLFTIYSRFYLRSSFEQYSHQLHSRSHGSRLCFPMHAWQQNLQINQLPYNVELWQKLWVSGKWFFRKPGTFTTQYTLWSLHITQSQQSKYKNSFYKIKDFIEKNLCMYVDLELMSKCCTCGIYRSLLPLLG